MRYFEFWTKMATKCKPQGPRCKKFEIWTKMAKVPKPQGLKWQFTLNIIKSKLQVLSFMFVPNCRRCPLPLSLTSFVLNLSKSCTF
ncbi:hypothetical protein Hanom_Chr08g00703871 [Helianthus anomalus]